MAERLGRAFFARPTLEVARQLLGQRLVRVDRGGQRLSGWIVEAEAYVGQADQGCHARSGRTERNASMWGPPGHAYVYFTYGMHWMLNMVTEEVDLPAAVLIRAIQPAEGERRMQARRRLRTQENLTNGPAKLCQALAIDRRLDGHDLCGRRSLLFVERAAPVAERYVTLGPRVGLDHVPEPWKSLPWRFRASAAGLPG